MKIYNKSDIEARFTEVVQEYLNEGMRINCSTMGGSQGEISKVDLTDGQKIFRVRLDSKADFRRDCDDTFIKVEAYVSGTGWRTLWNDAGEPIAEEHFLSLGWHGDPDAKFVTEEDYNRAGVADKRKKRCGSMYDEWENQRALKDYDKALVLKIVRSVKGLATCKLDNISRVLSVPSNTGRDYHIDIMGRQISTVEVGANGVRAW